MSLLDDLKAKADLNGDGKISFEDLESLRNGENGNVIDQLEQKADLNGDGKVSMEDVSGFDLGETLNNFKDKFKL